MRGRFGARHFKVEFGLGLVAGLGILAEQKCLLAVFVNDDGKDRPGLVRPNGADFLLASRVSVKLAGFRQKIVMVAKEALLYLGMVLNKYIKVLVKRTVYRCDLQLPAHEPALLFLVPDALLLKHLHLLVLEQEKQLGVALAQRNHVGTKKLPVGRQGRGLHSENRTKVLCRFTNKAIVLPQRRILRQLLNL